MRGVASYFTLRVESVCNVCVRGVASYFTLRVESVAMCV